MAENRTRQSSRGGRPWDLMVVVLATLVAAAMVAVPAFSASPIQVVVVLPLLLFLPGYALVSTLYVRRSETRDVTGERVVSRLTQGLDSQARVVLSVLASVAVVPLVALALNFTPFGIERVPVVVALTAVTLLFSIVAVLRRQSVPRRDRFAPAVPTAGVREWSLRGDSALGTVLNAVLVVSLFLALATTAYALAAPPSPQGEAFTEFYVLSENESGELVANDYPRDLVVGEPTELTVAVENHEGQSREYTVVVLEERVETDGGETNVIESEERQRIGVSVDEGETRYVDHTVTPTMSGENVRVTYLLYRGGAPARPTAEGAYRTLRLYVDVVESGA